MEDIDKSIFIKKKIYDLAIDLNQITFKFVRELDLLEPFGNNNSRPLFLIKGVSVKSLKRIGEEGKYIKAIIEDKGVCFNSLFFGDSSEFDKVFEKNNGTHVLEDTYKGLSSGTMDFLVTPSLNYYNGTVSVQLIINDFR